MDKILKEKLVSLLRKIYEEKIIENISILNINGNKDLITEGVFFDNEHTCYHTYDDIQDVITGLMVSANNYGIYFQDEFIGIISVFYQYYKDLSRYEMSICIKDKYRNKNIGKYCFAYVIQDCFEKTDIKSIHLSIREDNIKSRKVAEKNGFKLYSGYKNCKCFIDLNGNPVNQVQYLLRRNEYIRK